MNILWGLMGIVFVLFLAFLLSSRKKSIRFRPVLVGLLFQLIFAFLVLGSTWGSTAFEWLVVRVQDVIDTASEGYTFLFGESITETGAFAFTVLPVIIFFSSLIGILYYIGVMQVIIKFIGGVLSALLKTSKAESMSAAANVFVGQTEAPLVVRPFLANMTKSELFAVMTGGLGSVAGSVLFGYAGLGIPLDYLLAASFMAAPGGLIIAKVIFPEPDLSLTTDEIEIEKDTESHNVIDAAARGASTGLQLALNVGAMLIAFVALIAMINLLLGWVTGWFGADGITLELLLGYVFAPVAFMIGVPWSEALQAGGFIGQKLVLNEFVAYANFAPEIDSFSEKSQAIITFALCGFANLSSLAIILGGFASLAPTRRNDIAQMGLKAVAAGALVSLLSASIAGMFVL
ncbi:NupC/NupG family nucleoside CNT transporter [Marinococcus halophilus]|uniref:Nucleoside permease n=1 Tax=Marinococcus halophilus TaxID=1371 RepID=A0A510Y399_MARHA|nr:NupC/NupG family nucleoside CNT transporter [Marinococcus halophilus]OZT80757.1 NupC/NupG family nucleoside CNT transporter [Marinococcus halophilus]GEK57808.1 putative transporter YutK [Marinococcus halophilus]